MFKSKEEIKKKHCSESSVAEIMMWDAIDDTFKSIAERKEFYRRYSSTLKDNKMMSFPKDYPNLYEQFIKWNRVTNLGLDDWLFSFCFDGVE